VDYAENTKEACYCVAAQDDLRKRRGQISIQRTPAFAQYPYADTCRETVQGRRDGAFTTISWRMAG
jgi:hypothetical protein